MKSKFVLAYTTFPDMDSATRICEQLVSESTVACANILPSHQAIYRWKGQIQRENEVAVILKTTEAKKPRLKARFCSLHPYETPCLVFIKIDDGLPGYLNWLYVQSL